MEPTTAEAKPVLATYSELAKMFDHSLLRPELNDWQVEEGCRTACHYDVASVIVRPCDVELALRLVSGSGVVVGSVAGFPHGSSTTAAKLYELRDILRRGVKQIDFVLSISNLIERRFQHVETELQQVANSCREAGAVSVVIFENAYLTNELKIVACRICSRVGVNFISTSTGFGPSGATLEDVRLMRSQTNPDIQVKAAGGVKTLDQALEFYEAGCSRLSATVTASILDEWKKRIEPEPAAPPA
jgi:deoxyribose-phosphate aldolase